MKYLTVKLKNGENRSVDSEPFLDWLVHTEKDIFLYEGGSKGLSRVMYADHYPDTDRENHEETLRRNEMLRLAEGEKKDVRKTGPSVFEKVLGPVLQKNKFRRESVNVSELKKREYLENVEKYSQMSIAEREQMVKKIAQESNLPAACSTNCTCESCWKEKVAPQLGIISKK